jgi:hypothetical protein
MGLWEQLNRWGSAVSELWGGSSMDLMCNCLRAGGGIEATVATSGRVFGRLPISKGRKDTGRGYG